MSDSKNESRAVTRLVTADEREEAVQLLSAAFANDAIAVSELERRMAQVYEAESTEALQLITRDLPKPAPERATLPAMAAQPTSVVPRPKQQITSVLSGVERSVQGPVPEVLELRSVMGSLELDLRRAEFPAGVTEIRVKAMLGSVEVELPDHVQLEHEGHALLGVFSVRGRSRSRGSDGAPVVRITGRSILANVEVELDD